MRSALVLGFVFFAGIVGSGLSVTTAQDTPDVGAPPDRPTRWEAGVHASGDRVSGGRDAWQRWGLSLKRAVGAGTIMGRLERQSRFGTPDVGGRLEGWHDLWDGAWGHVQLGLGPRAMVYPRGTVQADVTQSAGAWELTAQYTWRTYATDEVHMVRPQVAHYVGAWYLRGFATLVPRVEKWAATGGIGARRFLESSQSYVDVEAGFGRSVEFAGPNSELLAERTAYVSARTQYFFLRRMGIQAGVRYSNDGFFERVGGSAGLLVRW